MAAVFTSAAIALSLPVLSFAGQWKLDNNGWWYQNDDGSWTSNGWQLINGQYYYFNGSGYMLANTTTPDGYYVGADGAWVQNAAAATTSTDYSGNYKEPNGRYYMYLTLNKIDNDTYKVKLETEHGTSSTFADATGRLENGVLKFSNTANTNFTIDFSGWDQGYFTLHADQKGYTWDKVFNRNNTY